MKAIENRGFAFGSKPLLDDVVHQMKELLRRLDSEEAIEQYHDIYFDESERPVPVPGKLSKRKET